MKRNRASVLRIVHTLVLAREGGYLVHASSAVRNGKAFLFAGDLARPGANLRAPLAALYLLAQGPENRIDDISAADAARGLLSCILFFAEDPELVQAVFQSALDFVERVPVRRLTFVPDARVWELIG